MFPTLFTRKKAVECNYHVAQHSERIAEVRRILKDKWFPAGDSVTMRLVDYQARRWKLLSLACERLLFKGRSVPVKMQTKLDELSSWLYHWGYECWTCLVEENSDEYYGGMG